MEKQRHARSKTTAQYPRQIKPHTPRSEQESGKCRRIVVVADNLFVVGLIVLLVGGLGWVGRLCLLLFFVFVCCLFFLGGGGGQPVQMQRHFAKQQQPEDTLASQMEDSHNCWDWKWGTGGGVQKWVPEAVNNGWKSGCGPRFGDYHSVGKPLGAGRSSCGGMNCHSSPVLSAALPFPAALNRGR